jgi:butyrate kinase
MSSEARRAIQNFDRGASASVEKRNNQRLPRLITLLLNHFENSDFTLDDVRKIGIERRNLDGNKLAALVNEGYLVRQEDGSTYRVADKVYEAHLLNGEQDEE